MIKTFIFNLLVSIADMILSLLDVLPDMPVQVTLLIDNFFDLIWNGATLVNLFIDIQYVSILFGLLISVIGFIHGYKMIMWVLNKIPIIDID